MTANNLYYQHHLEKSPDFTAQVCFDYFNCRLRVDDYSGNIGLILKKIEQWVYQYSFAKVFVKTRPQDWQLLLRQGYMLEGILHGYFHGQDAFCMAIYTDLSRHTSDYWIEEDRILFDILQLPQASAKSKQAVGGAGFTIRQASADDAPRLAKLYSSCFSIYPTPIDDPAYIEQAMEAGTLFYLVEQNAQVVSAASAEVNPVYQNAELTDCATLPEHRQGGLMGQLIQTLEEKLYQQNIYYLYSLARALSFGMNAVFYRLGYQYAGRMTKNCKIYDKFEDMNVWTKHLINRKLTGP